MKYRFFMAIALMTGAIGCSVNVLESEQDESLKIVFEASPFVDGDREISTRTSVVPNESYTVFDFIWSAKDTVGIYPDAGSQVFFTMENGAGASSATFDGGAWTCKDGHVYRSYYPFIGDIYLDKTKIPVSFLGQKQVGNANSDHFQKYDYMYTAAATKESGFLNFTYKHLGTVVLPWVELPAGHYTGLTLSLDEALFVTEGEYDLTAASPAIVGKKYSDSMSIDLDVTFTSPDILKVYVPLAPMDMSGKTLTITITDEDERVFQYTYNPSKPYVASKIYRLKAATSLVPSDVIDYSKEPFTLTSAGSISVSIIKSGSPDDIILEYKKSGEDWADYTIGSAIALADGESIQFRAGEEGNTTLSSSGSNWHIVSIDGAGTAGVSGNIMSLLDKNLQRSDLADFCFCRLFYGCTILVNASNLCLPITTLARNCYGQMFQGCTGLTSAPDLPATSLARACYSSMFQGCTGLTSAPDLPATSLAINCYYYMFDGCTGLTTAPDLPATIMQDLCYFQMFQGCTSLTTAPSLPATSLAKSCYQGMFSGCTSLTTAPSLPATSLADNCYTNMFSGCISLTTAPDLPASFLAEGCYSGMFSNCTSFTVAPALPATTLARSCYNSMFSGCTSLTTAPELPATTLTDLCYDSMFSGCTSLTIAPELPATTLVSGCYSGMFFRCSNLNYIKILATDFSSSSCLNNWVYGVATTGTFVKSSSASWSIIGASGVPSGWTVVTG